MAGQASDLVLSYCVPEGVPQDHKAIADALEEGYRVLDVIQTPVTPGGGSNGPRPMCDHGCND